jgi:hypothetical protein
MNLQDRELELNWREVTCKRSVSTDNFPRGIQDYDFSVSGKSAFIPSLSYFVIDATLEVRTTKIPVFNENISNVVTEAQAVEIGTDEATFRRPSVADGIAFADHFGSTLYNNAFFRAGNSDVSFITQYIPQAGVLKSRLDKSFAWSKSIGRIVTQDDADFERRRQYISIDGKFHDDGLKPLQYTKRNTYNISGEQQTATAVDGSTWEYLAASGELTYVQGAATPTDNVSLQTTGVQVGDIIQLGSAVDLNTPTNKYFEILSIVRGPEIDSVTYIPITTTTRFVVKPVRNTTNASLTPAFGSTFTIWAAHDPACGFNRTQIMFQPPLGIFSEANAISGGDFKISLNPSPNYQVNGVQSLRAMQPFLSAQSPGDFKLVINDVKFYVATINSDVSPTGVIPLSLVEMAVLNKTMNSSIGSQNLDFTVPPSTLAITVFVQGSNAGTTTTLPSTKFYFQGDKGAIDTTKNVNGISGALIDNDANNLQQIQVTYGSITKTQTLYDSAFYNTPDVGVNRNIQRFLQSIQYSGKIVSDGGAECQPQYLERGNYWHFDFHKDKNDTSSYVNVQLGFSNPEVGNSLGEGQNLFIVAHYSRQCEISYENGFITQVVAVNR